VKSENTTNVYCNFYVIQQRQLLDEFETFCISLSNFLSIIYLLIYLFLRQMAAIHSYTKIKENIRSREIIWHNEDDVPLTWNDVVLSRREAGAVSCWGHGMWWVVIHSDTCPSTADMFDWHFAGAAAAVTNLYFSSESACEIQCQRHCSSHAHNTIVVSCQLQQAATCRHTGCW